MKHLTILTAILLLAAGLTTADASIHLVDNDSPDVTLIGTWNTSIAATPHIGDNYLYTSADPNGTSEVRYAPDLPNGSYLVEAFWPYWDKDRPDDTPFTILYSGNIYTQDIVQIGTGGEWFELGTFYFSGSQDNNYVAIGNGASTGNVIADAIRFTAVPEPTTVVIWSLLSGMGLVFANRGRNHR